MGLITGPAKGETAKLNITDEGRRRILIGLSWDSKDLSHKELLTQTLASLNDIAFGDITLIKANIKRIYEKADLEGQDTDDQNFDLDLSCFAFNEQGIFQALVDPLAWNAIDESGKIYHSGEDMTGDGGGDDEQVYFELNELPDNLQELFIVVQSDCAHSFDKVLNPMIRVADSKSDANCLQVNINQLEHSDAYGFVFCRIFKQNDSWHITNISAFCQYKENWSKFLAQYRG